MIKFKIATLFLLSAYFLLSSGCSKKRGCADINACNFEPSAEKNDGSCIYETPWYLDSDGDGFGDPSQYVIQCEQPSGYVDNANGSIGLPATNFTSTDCNGVSHNLFAELDAGLIVVMIWVMPCSSCIPDAIDALNVVNSYTSSHPGRVVFYMVDDYGNNSCQDLNVWSDWYGLSASTRFSDPAIDMGDYGVAGMPKLVVLGGSNHQVYFNKNSTTVGLTDAVNQALTDNP